MSAPKAIFYKDPINVRLTPEKLADFVRWSGTNLDSGDLFLFFNRKRDRCKIVWHDREAFCVLEKQLSKGTFAPNDKIELPQSVIDDCLYGGFAGQRQLLHVLMGNVKYLDDARR